MITAHPERPVRETLFRGAAAPVATELVRVDRTGGKYGAGILRGVSLIAAGEALGHDMWIDEVTLQQVADAAAFGKNGVKSRFTHPSMSADGMGRHLGRIHDVRLDAGRVVGDLHFAESAHSTPDGDLAGYVMSLAEEDPAAAGLSIVFEHDQESEYEFVVANGGEGAFESPDELNEKNLPHVRLSKLRAADVVDEPAANPDGMFDVQPLARQVDDILSYAAGLTTEKPDVKAFGIDGDRATQFLGRWLSSHGLSITPVEDPTAMAEQQQTPANEPAEPAITRESLFAEQKRYVEKFGSDDGVKWFMDGRSFQDALSLFCDKQAERIAALETELSETKAKLASLQLGESKPVETVPGEESKKITFAQAVKSSRN